MDQHFMISIDYLDLVGDGNLDPNATLVNNCFLPKRLIFVETG